MAGVHSSTKVYMAPSNSDWIKPRQRTLRSVPKENRLKKIMRPIKPVLLKRESF